MRVLQRIVALCLVALLSVWLFYYGREHKIFIDNKTIQVEDKSFRALKLVRVTVNDAPPVEMTQRERDVVKVLGPSFKLKVEVMDEFGEEVEKEMERELNIGFKKNVMLSIPLMASDWDDYILPPPVIQPISSEPEIPAGDIFEGLAPGEIDVK